ncbi:methyl-accepting chemotaxis protein [Stigmatella sp. ncwal1]|uniref:Methyl-accepting chemotaxis protein n=1 Tax=Stigmatella ashevillensis TaxID=2995309 RepID=A0ABT5D907_9BACT|nr:methyl-accepting chemotaxis protein [Stigmatella ashevillena]MDC0709308.1 methyl-accepting chemotaxis protein [Stigmatella ashevillena]
MSEHRARQRASFSLRLIAPVPLATAIGVALSCHYAWLTLGDRLIGMFHLFVGLGTVLCAIATVTGVAMLLRRLRALRSLERGEVPPSQERLSRAMVEATSVADATFVKSLLSWLVCSVLLGAVVGMVGGGGWSAGLGIVGLGVLFGPITSLLVHCLVTLRARQVMLWLTDLGLSQSQVIAAMPQRAQIRGRLVLFTVISVVTPAVFCSRLASALADQAYERVLTSPASLQAERAQALQADAFVSGGVLCLLVFALALTTAYLGGTLLGRPIRQLADEARRIAAGDLAAPHLIPAEDEVWAVSAAFAMMRAHLADVLSQLQRAGAQISSTTEEILATSGRYEAGASEQASSLDETSATTEELARSARQIAENAGSVSEIAHRTLSAAEAGQGSAEAFLASMGRMRNDNQAIASAVNRLNKRVQQIGKIVEFINGVADKSDLLALNAELEGTKAGEVGRGFSLVAAEMRRLAENVLESTKEIEGLIEEVREASRAAVAATDGGVRATETGTLLAQHVSESLKQIVELASQTSDAVRSISLATQQQQTGTDQLADTMADILRITQQSLNATKQVSTANGDLLVLALDLRAVVERFQIGQVPPRGDG